MACKKCGGKGCSSCQKSRSSSVKPFSNRVSALKHPESSSRSGSSGKISSSSKSSGGSAPLYLSKRDSPKIKEPSNSGKPSSSKLKESSKPKESPKPKESSSQPSNSKKSSSSKNTGSSSQSSSSSAFKTAYKTDHDRKMASRQTKIESLPKEERKKQEEWAQKQLQSPGLSPCPGGLDWTRHAGGYVCDSGLHFIPDAVLAEGKGGYYMRCLRATLGGRSALFGLAAPPESLKTIRVGDRGQYDGPYYPTPEQITLSKRLKEIREGAPGGLFGMLGGNQGADGLGGSGGNGVGGHLFGRSGSGGGGLRGLGGGGSGF